MNTSFLNIIKQIIADNGEAVLIDPARLKAFFSDLAKDEPKSLRIAFGRCIEAGAYTALKTAADASERTERKALVVQKVHDEYGLDIGLCNEALDILEAAMFGIALSATAGQTQTASAPRNIPPVSASPQYQQPQYTPPPYAAPAKSHAPRNVLIAVIALALIAALAAMAYKNASPWQGFADFDSFARAGDIEFTEEGFMALMSLAMIFNKYNNEFDVQMMSGEQLTESYGVPRTLRKKYSYLVKTSTGVIAYFNDGKWVVITVPGTGP